MNLANFRFGMWRAVKGLGLAELLLVTACGGVVEGGSHNPPAETGASKDTTTTAAADSTGPAAGVDLGECKLGPLEDLAESTPCAWVADNRCYQAREMACNCACPRSRDSQCFSGFEAGPDGHVWVACH